MELLAKPAAMAVEKPDPKVMLETYPGANQGAGSDWDNREITGHPGELGQVQSVSE